MRWTDGTARRGSRILITGMLPGYRRRLLGIIVQFSAFMESEPLSRRDLKYRRMTSGAIGSSSRLEHKPCLSETDIALHRGVSEKGYTQ